MFLDPNAVQEEIVLDDKDRDQLDLDEDMDVIISHFTNLKSHRMIPHQMHKILPHLLHKTILLLVFLDIQILSTLSAYIQVTNM